MLTTSHIPHTRRSRRGAIAVLLVSAVVAGAAMMNTYEPVRPVHATAPDLDGRDALQPDSKKPKITAAFPREGYQPGASAHLDFYSRATRVTLQFFRAGLENGATK